MTAPCVTPLADTPSGVLHSEIGNTALPLSHSQWGHICDLPLGDNVKVSFTVGHGMHAEDTSSGQVLAQPGMTEKPRRGLAMCRLISEAQPATTATENNPCFSSDPDDATAGI
jgi:hypothetical protein